MKTLSIPILPNKSRLKTKAMYYSLQVRLLATKYNCVMRNSYAMIQGDIYLVEIFDYPFNILSSDTDSLFLKSNLKKSVISLTFHSLMNSCLNCDIKVSWPLHFKSELTQGHCNCWTTHFICELFRLLLWKFTVHLLGNMHCLFLITNKCSTSNSASKQHSHLNTINFISF